MSDLDLWWLLSYPMAFVLGWFAARLDIRQVQRDSQAVPEQYFRALKLLLNDRYDAAIEAFHEVLRLDRRVNVLHFALGSLFRRRGELERAIRSHEDLLSLPDLSVETRADAQFELGQDFLKAGMLDRAESIFIALCCSHRADEARKFLLEIYQLQREWRKAVEIVDQAPEQVRRVGTIEVSHFLCELAQDARTRFDWVSAHGLLDQALERHPGSVRVFVLRGEFFLEQGRQTEALDAWLCVERQDALFLSLVVHVVVRVLTDLGRAGEVRSRLQVWLERYPSIDIWNALYHSLLAASDREHAYVLLRQTLELQPTLFVGERLLRMRLEDAEQADCRQDDELLLSLVQLYSRRALRYRCSHCGFKTVQYHWRCSGCGRWESYHPRRIEDVEL